MQGRQCLYASPSRSRVISSLENRFLAADISWWTGHDPIFVRTVADVPEALYLNYVAPKSYAAALAPELFTPISLPGTDDATLFTILIFRLERARPRWFPRTLAAFVPRIMQSNWRFYGHITGATAEPRPCVFFIRTVTTSLALAAFGRRLARCFPLRRARHMHLDWSGDEIAVSIDAGPGSAPALYYAGQRAVEPRVSEPFRQQFGSYGEYARWIIDQHVSVVLWPRECVVQDMHLDFRAAQIIPLTCREHSITGLDFMADRIELIDSFAVEGLKVFLDNIYIAPYFA
jgi:Uncharacterized conserved protein (COG2071)